jgi:hypothetical protein
LKTPEVIKRFFLAGSILLLSVPAFAQEAASITAATAINDVPGPSKPASESNKTRNHDEKPSSATNVPAPQPSTSDEWTFESAPYLWAAALKGNLRVGNNTVIVDSSFSDVFKQLDFAFATQFEAAKGRWRILIDENYVNLGTTGTGPLGQTTQVEPTLNFFEFGASYAPVIIRNEKATANEPLPPVFSLEILGGGRYTHFGLGLSRTNLNVEGSRNVVDAFAGARFKMRPHPAVTLIEKFTVGGGGSNHAWTFSSLVDFRFRKNMSAWGGYQILDMNADKPSNVIGFDGQMRGLIFGMTIYK